MHLDVKLDPVQVERRFDARHRCLRAALTEIDLHAKARAQLEGQALRCLIRRDSMHQREGVIRELVALLRAVALAPKRLRPGPEIDPSISGLERGRHPVGVEHTLSPTWILHVNRVKPL